MIALIECQANYAAAAIVLVISSGKRSMTVRESVCSAYNQRIQARLTHSVWSGCSSWYNLAGKKNVVLWPGTVTEYFLQTRRVQEQDYDFA